MKKIARLSVVAALLISGMVMPFVVTANAEAYTQPGYNGRIFYNSPYDGSEITTKNEIYSQMLDGSNKTRLTVNEINERYFDISPDGTKILYSAPGSGADIYVMNLDGSNVANLTNTPGQDWFPVWSWDGTKIAFRSERTGNSEVFVMNADGSNQVNISNNAGATNNLDYGPAWSTDGQSVFFVSQRSGTQHIYRYNFSDQSVVNISNRVEPTYDPSVSPDGNLISFVADIAGDYTIMTMNLDGSNQQVRSNPGDWSDSQEWSPDGSKIAYLSYEGVGYAVRVVDITSGVNTLIVNFSTQELPVEWARTLVWSPDGKELLVNVYTDPEYNIMNIYHVNVASGEVELFTPEDYSTAYAWEALPNTAPIATTDTLSVPYHIPTLLDVLANDIDEEAFSGTNLSLSAQPTNGTASVVDGKIRYVPNDSFVGADSLTYQICDSYVLDQLCDTGAVNISVLEPTAPDVAVSRVNGEDFSPGTNTYVTSSFRPTLYGTATPGAEVTVEIHSDPIVLTTTADGSGNWSVTPTFDLASGDHTVYISATQYGLTTELGSFGLTVQPSLANTGECLRWIVGGCILIMLAGAGLLGISKDNRRILRNNEGMN